MVDLSVEVGGLQLKNPVMAASGTFGYGQEYSDLVDLNRLGAIVTKAITLKPRPGNPPPRIVETPAGMLNSIGLANVGVESFIRDKLPFLRGLETKIIVNIAGSSAEEYEEVTRRLEDAPGIHGYEINLSCPNVKEGGMSFGCDERFTFGVTRRIRKLTKRPLIVKLTPNVTSIGPIALAAQEAGADALSLINTLVGMAVDVETRRPKLATITGGLSGPAIKPVALAKVFEAVKSVDIPVIGVGGILTYQDALEFIMIGASAVQVGSAVFLNPLSLEEIIRGLGDWCQEKGITRIRQLIGCLKIYEFSEA